MMVNNRWNEMNEWKRRLMRLIACCVGAVVVVSEMEMLVE